MAFFFQQNDGLGCVIGIGVIVLVIVLVSVENAKKKKQLEQAEYNYRSSLDDLRRNPTNPSLRIRTLELGRILANLTRNKKGVTVFDEVALSNDIAAACAAAAAAPDRTTAPVAFTSATVSIQDRLRQLDDLRTQALITEDEYAARREKILDEV